MIWIGRKKKTNTKTKKTRTKTGGPHYRQCQKIFVLSQLVTISTLVTSSFAIIFETRHLAIITFSSLTNADKFFLTIKTSYALVKTYIVCWLVIERGWFYTILLTHRSSLPKTLKRKKVICMIISCRFCVFRHFKTILLRSRENKIQSHKIFVQSKYGSI